MENVTKTAGVLIFKDEKVLLVKHSEKAKHETGVYGIPAGRLEPGETEIEAAIRETFDETKLIINPNNLQHLPNIYSAKIKRKNETERIFSVKVFLCNKYKGKPQETDENIPEWVNIDELKKYNLLPNMEKIINDGLKLI